jgi:hypothetical protein
MHHLKIAPNNRLQPTGCASEEAAMVRVAVRGRLADARRRVVRERDSERATFAGVERMHEAGHAGRHHPRRHRARIEKRAIDDRAGAFKWRLMRVELMPNTSTCRSPAFVESSQQSEGIAPLDTRPPAGITTDP